PQLAVSLREDIVRLRIVGVQLDGLLEPPDAEIDASELNERLAREKEVARLVWIALRRFDGQIEGALMVPELDQQIREVGVDDVVVRMVLVNEGDGLQIA